MSAVRQPLTVVPPCRSTSIKRIIRVSWILMPGTLLRPHGMASASRWNSGKSTCTSRAWASKAAKRSVTAANVRRTASRLSRPLFNPKIFEVVAQRLQAEEGGEFLVYAEDGVLAD